MSPSQNPLPPTWKIHLMMAWDNWLKTVATTALLVVLPLTLINVYLEGEMRGRVLAWLVILGLAAWMAHTWRYHAGSHKARLIGYGLIVLIGLAAAWPVAQPLLLHQTGQRMTFDKVDESHPISAEDPGERWYLMEVHGQMATSSGPTETPYILRLQTGEEHQILHGSLRREWKRVKIGRKTRSRQLSTHDRSLHRFTADLSRDASLILRKLDGKLNGPLEVFIRPEPVMTGYLLMVDAPLLLLAALLELFEEEKRRSTALTSKTAFILSFGAVFADNLAPGYWFGPLILAGGAGMVAALLFGVFVPKIVRKVLPGVRA